MRDGKSLPILCCALVSVPGPGMWDFGLYVLFFGFELVCLIALLAWLSDVVFDSFELSACARDVGFVS